MKSITAAAWIALWAAGAALAAPEQAPVADPAVVNADNAFGLKLFKVLRDGGAENAAISPLSVALALQMVFNGARGPTRHAMAAALQLNGLAAENLDTANQALQASLASTGPQIQMTIANSLWLRHGGREVAPPFTQAAREHYAAQIGDLDGVPGNVNAWINQKTQGLIPQLLPAKDYSNAVALIANAIYFKGAWTSPFDPHATAPALFTSGGTRVNCSMMKRRERVLYLEAADFRAIQLPYGAERRLSMMILLPNDAHSVAAVAAEATPEHLAEWLNHFRSTTVSISLPRFKVSTRTSLPAALKALGMGAAFDPSHADFSGIAPGVYLSDVEHAVLVQVDESGTTAAAATGALTMSVSAELTPPIAFTVDHPFLFAIRDQASGALLFVGTVANPGAG